MIFRKGLPLQRERPPLSPCLGGRSIRVPFFLSRIREFENSIYGDLEWREEEHELNESSRIAVASEEESGQLHELDTQPIHIYINKQPNPIKYEKANTCIIACPCYGPRVDDGTEPGQGEGSRAR